MPEQTTNPTVLASQKEVKGDLSPRSFRILLSLSGVLGVVALLLYFSAPFVIFPFPQADATSAQLVQNVARYQDYYLLAAWLQGTGTLLSVLFVLGLAFLARAWNRFSSWITLLASTVVLILSLMEGSYFIDVVLATANGHPQAALSSFDLTFVFLHTFFIAPSILLPLAFVLRNSQILLRLFWYWALAAGIAFQTVGLAGLFTPSASVIAIVVLMVQELWFLTAAVTVGLRKTL
jgi:hypothetical protein